MNRPRESNYDLMRIIAAFAVVLMHVVNVYYQELTDVNGVGLLYSDNIFFIILVKVLTRFSVPCFFMLSGAFLLEDERNADFHYFYRKQISNVGVDTLIFSLAGISLFIITGCIKNDAASGVIDAFLNLLKGEPFYHIWYLSVLGGLYIVTPYLIRLSAALNRGGVLTV